MFVIAVDLLLREFKADKEARDHLGYTPLHMAARKGYNDLVRVLRSLVRPRMRAETQQRLLRRGHRCLVFVIGVCVCKQAWPSSPRFLRSQGADPSPEDKVGWTPLTHAAALGHVNVVRTFVQDLKCDTGHRTRHGESLLHVAARHG